MKTTIKTTTKSNENVTVQESVEDIFNILIDKYSFAMFNAVAHSGKVPKVIIRKSSIKMVK